MRTDIITSRVRKQKSIKQIREQVDRIVRLQADRKKSVDAMNRVIGIGDRYVRNIAQSKRFANDINQGRGLETARGRAYSQNTYMGINAG